MVHNLNNEKEDDDYYPNEFEDEDDDFDITKYLSDDNDYDDYN